MALNPVEVLNVFDKDLSTELRNRSKVSNLLATRSPFLRFTTAAKMADLKDKLGNAFAQYNGCEFFTLGLHGYQTTDYSVDDLYNTKDRRGLVVGTTYRQPNAGQVGQQILVYTHGTDSPRNFPPPGITNARVERLRSGNVLRMTIEVSCYTQDQLQLLDNVCFVPGMTCILEWGNIIQKTSSLDTITKRLDFKDLIKARGHIRLAMNRTSRSDFINEWCKPNNFNYDWAVAHIANIKTVIEDNVYKTTIVAYGKADNLMYISAYATTNPLKPELISNSSQIIASSITEYFKQNGKFSQALRGFIDNPSTIPNQYKNKIIKFSNAVNQEEKAKAIGTAQNTGTINDLGYEDAYFISMDFLVHILNNNVNGVLAILNSAISTGNTLQKLLVPLDGPDKMYVGYNEFLRSTSPEVCIIHNKNARRGIQTGGVASAAIEQIGTPDTRTIGALTPSEGTNAVEILGRDDLSFGFDQKDNITTMDKGIWINSKAVQSAFLNARTIFEGLEALLRNINAATENYWNLSLFYDDEQLAFRILDNNLRTYGFTKDSEIYEFNKKLQSNETDAQGPEVIDIQINTDYPKMLFSQLAVSGINGGRLLGDQNRTDMDFKLQTSVGDIFFDDPRPPQRTVPPPARTSREATDTFEALEKRLSGNNLGVGLASIPGELKKVQITKLVSDIITELYSMNRQLTPSESVAYQNRILKLKQDGDLTIDDVEVLKYTMGRRLSLIIAKRKNAEKIWWEGAVKAWKDSGKNVEGGIISGVYQSAENAVLQAIIGSSDPIRQSAFDQAGLKYDSP